MKKSMLMPLGALVVMAAASCTGKKDAQAVTASGLDPQNFVAVVDGDTTGLFTLKNANGMEVNITNYGGRIVSLMVPNRSGELTDVVLGFDSVQAYFPENNKTDFGASIGRYANRINQGKFVIDADTVQLPLSGAEEVQQFLIRHQGGASAGENQRSVVTKRAAQITAG